MMNHILYYRYTVRSMVKKKKRLKKLMLIYFHISMPVNLDATHNRDTNHPMPQTPRPPSGKMTDRRSAILRHTLKGLSTKHNQYFLVRDLKKKKLQLLSGGMQSEKCVDRFPYSCTLPLGLATWQPVGCTGPQARMKRKFSQSLSRLQEEDTQKCRLQAQRHRNARSLGHHQSWWTTTYSRRQLQAGLCRGVLIYELGHPHCEY